MNDKQKRAAKGEELARPAGLDRNPRRRCTGLLERAITAGLLALFLAGAPLLAFGAADWADRAGLSEQRAQLSWHSAVASATGWARRPITSGRPNRGRPAGYPRGALG